MSYSKNSFDLHSLNFDEISVGLSVEIEHLITQDDVNSFASLSGDFNPLHVDAKFAQSTNFRKPVVHGMLTASFISTIIGMKLPGAGALWSSQTLEFLKPAFIGDRITLVSKVVQKSNSTKSLVLETKVFNQNNQLLLLGKSVVKCLGDDAKTYALNFDNVIINANKVTSPDSPLNLEIPVLSKEVLPVNDSVVLVTGAGQGIGEAIAKKISESGRIVVFNHLRTNERTPRLINYLREKGFHVEEILSDVTNVEELIKLREYIESNLGVVRDVIHCAAPTPVPTPLENLDWSQFQDQIDVQLKGAFNCAQIFIPKMIELGGGSFIFIGSTYAEGIPPSQQAHYVSTKAALSAFARSLAVEMGPRGIRANVIAPGMTLTDMLSGIPDKTKLLAKMNTPLRKLAMPEDIANMAEFLIGIGGRHITGETLRVCGGSSM